MYKILYGEQNGRLHIVTLRNPFESETDAEEKARHELRAQEISNRRNVQATVVLTSVITDIFNNNGGRYFRDAWEYVAPQTPEGSAAISVNMDRAKAIMRNHVREVRKPLLEALDVEFLRAQEAGNDTADIVRRKQELRDLPQAADIDSAVTAQDLFDWWPESLLGVRNTEGRAHPR